MAWQAPRKKPVIWRNLEVSRFSSALVMALRQQRAGFAPQAQARHAGYGCACCKSWQPSTAALPLAAMHRPGESSRLPAPLQTLTFVPNVEGIGSAFEARSPLKCFSQKREPVFTSGRSAANCRRLPPAGAAWGPWCPRAMRQAQRNRAPRFRYWVGARVNAANL